MYFNTAIQCKWVGLWQAKFQTAEHYASIIKSVKIMVRKQYYTLFLKRIHLSYIGINLSVLKTLWIQKLGTYFTYLVLKPILLQPTRWEKEITVQTSVKNNNIGNDFFIYTLHLTSISRGREKVELKYCHAY